jgi:hypothetical protein
MTRLEFLPGTFIGSCGLLRTGKTMNMVRMAQFCKRGGMRVVTNFTCSFADARVSTLADLFDESVVSNCILCLDEVQTIIDSREFAKNAEVTRWLIWLGKLGVVLCWTTPTPAMADIRLRQLTGWLWLCSRTVHRGDWVTVAQLVYTASSPEGQGVDMGKSVFRQKDYYGLYDTLDRNTSLKPK